MAALDQQELQDLLVLLAQDLQAQLVLQAQLAQLDLQDLQDQAVDYREQLLCQMEEARIL
jgi:hypothetical protein